MLTTAPMTPITPAIEVDADTALTEFTGDLPGGHSFMLEALTLGAHLQSGATIEEAVAAFIGTDPEDHSRARTALGIEADAEIPMTVETAIAFLTTFAC